MYAPYGASYTYVKWFETMIFWVIFICDKDSLIIKIKLLDENRHKVMAKQLLLLHNGVSSYFAGNQQALEGSIQQFNIQQKKSFLEQ